MKERENLLDCDKRDFAAIIRGFPVKGKVYVENGIVYLCQDFFASELKHDKYGYKHLYCVYEGLKEDLIDRMIQDFAIYPETAEEIEEFYDWHVGDILVKKNNFNFLEIIFRSGEYVAYKTSNLENILIGDSTCKKLYDIDWRLKIDLPKEKTTEILMSEIHEKFNIPLNEKIIIKND